jgi:hypothetical protein
MYKSCNTSKPLATYTSGNDSITIITRGHHFFFCGVPGHCQSGQKVDINVPRNLSTAPTPSALVSPLVPAATVPAPSLNKAAALNDLKGRGGSAMLWLAMTIVALLVSASA